MREFIDVTEWRNYRRVLHSKTPFPFKLPINSSAIDFEIDESWLKRKQRHFWFTGKTNIGKTAWINDTLGKTKYYIVPDTQSG